MCSRTLRSLPEAASALASTCSASSIVRVAFEQVGEFEIGVDVGRLLLDRLLEHRDAVDRPARLRLAAPAAAAFAAGRRTPAGHSLAGDDRLLDLQSRDLAAGPRRPAPFTFAIRTQQAMA